MKNARTLQIAAPLAIALLAAALLAASPRRVVAQVAARQWHVTGELAGVIGGTWLNGSTAPTVTTAPGVVLGIDVHRNVSSRASAGASVRIGAQPLSLTERETKWSGGTLTEGNALGVVSLFATGEKNLNISLDFGFGIALLSGARSILPFRDASSLSPLGELGVSLHRNTTGLKSARYEQGLFVRYSMLRLDASAAEATATTGWVSRLTAGVRISK